MTDPYNGKGRFRWCFELWGENVPLSDVIEHLDEAKKEFPTTYTPMLRNTSPWKEFMDWFEKYFGDKNE